MDDLLAVIYVHGGPPVRAEETPFGVAGERPLSGRAFSFSVSWFHLRGKLVGPVSVALPERRAASDVESEFLTGEAVRDEIEEELVTVCGGWLS